MTRKRIVIVGGSFGGINAAYALRRKLGGRVDITVVSRDREFTFLPSLPSVILGWRDPKQLLVPLEKPLSRRGVRFINGEVRGLDPDRGEIRTGSSAIPYDYLVVASGAELDYNAVPGLGPASGYTQSTFTVEEAIAARDALARILAADGGRLIVAAAPGASCIGPAYEIAMMIDAELRARRKRHKFSVLFLTPEPFLGHFGVDGIGMSKRMIEDEFADRHIASVVSARISEIRPDRVALADGSQHPFDFALVIPSFLGSKYVRNVDGLANPKGFVTVTRELRSLKYPNIYAAGVAVAIPPPSATPVPVAVPKTGHMTELMAQAAAHNIAADIAGGAQVDGLSLPSTCIADAGDTGFYLSADPFLPPRNKVVHRRGKWARHLKLAFEHYYIFRIRHDWPSVHFGW